MKMLEKISPLLVLLAGAIAYAGSFYGAFLFDDYIWIVDNADLRSMGSSVVGTSRPFIGLTFYLNYLVSGLKVADYHLVNLLIHLGAGLFLLGVLTVTFRTPRLAGRYGTVAPALALLITLVWLVHPVQTESVTYIVQRSESLMGMFYLLTLYCFIRGATSVQGHRWQTAGIVACALGMACKPVMMTAPLVVFLYDGLFLEDSFRAVFGKRSRAYLLLMLTLLIPFSLLSVPNESSTSAGFSGLTLSPLHYLMTQPGVILHYIGISLWPRTLCMDYDWDPAQISVRTVVECGILACMVLYSLWLCSRRILSGFPALCFFLLLLPSSSVIPLSDCAAEHRLYLPLACLVAMGGVLAVEGWRRLGLLKGGEGRSESVVLLVIALGFTIVLSMGTMARNRVYLSERTMWMDVLATRPDNLRALLGVGVAHLKAGKLADAAPCFNRIISMDTDRTSSSWLRHSTEFAMAYNNLGIIHLQCGRRREAAEAFRRSIEIAPSAEALGNMGLTR